MSAPGWKKWLAWGTGAGIEVAGGALRVSVLKMRPQGPRALGRFLIERFRERPAAEWGAEFQDELRKLGASHVAAMLVLPRREVIVRPVALPGVADADLEAALQFQMDGLHPYGDEEVAVSWSRLGAASWVLAAIARKEVVERYSVLFREAGVKLQGFTFSAAALYSGLRLLTPLPAGGFLLIEEGERGAELYGESPSRPLFSASFPGPSERAVALARAEMRLDADAPVKRLEELLGAGAGLADLAAVIGACPRLALGVNLLPESERTSSSRLRYAPTLALAALAVVLLVAAGLYGRWADHRYLQALEAEVRALEPQARKVAAIDGRMEAAKARMALLAQFAEQSRKDLDALKEVTRLLPPPVWLHTLELSPAAILIGGEADQAAPLLKMLDSSPMFQNSEFTTPLNKGQSGEAFRIRAAREAGR